MSQPIPTLEFAWRAHVARQIDRLCTLMEKTPLACFYDGARRITLAEFYKWRTEAFDGTSGPLWQDRMRICNAAWTHYTFWQRSKKD